MKTFLLLIAVTTLALSQVASAPDVNGTNAAASLALFQQDYATAVTQIGMLQEQVANLQQASAFVTQLNAACLTCQATIAAVISGQTGLVATQLCCGPTTVPPTPSAPAGVAIIYITPETVTVVPAPGGANTVVIAK